MICSVGSFDFLTGFALRMNYVNANLQYIRMFNISSLHPVDLGKVTKHNMTNVASPQTFAIMLLCTKLILYKVARVQIEDHERNS